DDATAAHHDAPPLQVSKRATVRFCSSFLALQRDFLYPPVPDLADPEIVLRAAVDRVDHAELFRELAGVAELADDLAGEADFVDFAALHALRLVRVRAVQVLCRAAGDADRVRRADVG